MTKMFDNLKELLSAVQDGLTSNSLRRTLSEVQGVKYGSKEISQPRVELGAGADLLEHYQKQWAEIHEGSEDCASAAEHVDKFVMDIHEKTKLRLVHASDLSQSLSSLPRLTAAVDECVVQLGSLQRLLLTVETELTELEDLVDRHETDQRKVDHHYHLSLYKEKKLAALEAQRGELAAGSAARHAERERRRLDALQGRRRAAADAFTDDVQRYLAAGVAPPSESRTAALEAQRGELAAGSAARHAERERRRLDALQGRRRAAADAFTDDVQRYLAAGAAPPKNPPPAEGLTLEQVQLDDTDPSALDLFLDS